MMKTLMSATALTALVAASSAYGQAQQDPMNDPLLANPPAATEQAPSTEMDTDPMATAPDATAPDAMEPEMGAEAEMPAAPAVPGDVAPPSEQVADATEVFIPQQEPGEVLASSLIGSTVENQAGESLGDINDVVLTDEGTVDGVIVGVGGFLGLGEKNVAVNFEAIDKTVDADGNIILTLNASQEEFENAPQYITVAGLRQQEIQEPAAPTAEPAVPAAE